MCLCLHCLGHKYRVEVMLSTIKCAISILMLANWFDIQCSDILKLALEELCQAVFDAFRQNCTWKNVKYHL